MALGGGEVIAARENVVWLGGSGTGKTHIATAMRSASCTWEREHRHSHILLFEGESYRSGESGGQIQED